MASDAVIERIVKLLRLAADQEGTHEGANAAAHAKRLMEQHGVFVVLEDEVEDMRPHEVGDMVDVFAAREVWIEGLSHLIGYIYDVEPLWQAGERGGVVLLMFDMHGDKDHLAAAKATFLDLLAFVMNERLPRRVIHDLTPERALFVFRAGVVQAMIARLSREKVARLERDVLPSSSETALVPIAVHRRSRHPFVDPMLDVPIQGSAAEFETGPEAVIFGWGMHSGRRAFLPRLRRVTDED